MSHDVHQRVAANRRRLTRNTLRAATGATALAVAAGLIAHAHGQAAGRANDAASYQSVAPAAVATATATATATQGSPLRRPAVLAGSTSTDAFVAPARRVVLPSGSAHVDGYPVRFPHTPEGAAALAVVLGRYSATLDYATADEVARLYTDPALDKVASEAAAALVRAERIQIGAPEQGAIPSGLSMSRNAFGGQWRQVSVDVYDVTVIGWTDVDGLNSNRRLVAGVTRVKWLPDAGLNGGDWKAVQAAGAARPSAVAELGSKLFNDLGYAAIEEARP